MPESRHLPQAKTYIRPVVGSGAKAQLILFDDGRHYVVKFKGNPQGLRVLSNELIANRLADLLRVPVAEGAVVRVSQEFIDFEPELYKHSFIGGLQYGSLFYEGAYGNPTERMLAEVADPELFAGIIVFDHLINNWDRRYHGDNLLFLAEQPPRLITIDHGHAFDGPEWTVEGLKKAALPVDLFYGHFYRVMGEFLRGNPFEAPLRRVEELGEEQLAAIMTDLPPEWCIGEAERQAMLEYLRLRRANLREAIEKLKRQRFPQCC
ncbi:MAG: hypothetical protein QHH02_04360 [Syntrophomonadaceae bacterium]|nr:hypothetical protein [Syntrophomonadaceae bacterium]